MENFFQFMTDFLAVASTPSFSISVLTGMETVELPSPSTDAWTMIASSVGDVSSGGTMYLHLDQSGSAIYGDGEKRLHFESPE